MNLIINAPAPGAEASTHRTGSARHGCQRSCMPISLGCLAVHSAGCLQYGIRGGTLSCEIADFRDGTSAASGILCGRPRRRRQQPSARPLRPRISPRDAVAGHLILTSKERAREVLKEPAQTPKSISAFSLAGTHGHNPCGTDVGLPSARQPTQRLRHPLEPQRLESNRASVGDDALRCCTNVKNGASLSAKLTNGRCFGEAPSIADANCA